MDFLTEEKLELLLPKVKEFETWSAHMTTVLPQYEIDTPKRVGAFIAQCGHESAGFTRLEENLNYSAEGLNKIFPKYFIRAGRDAKSYHRQPEKIANVVYANRMGNGAESTGDGWKFRGRGIIQITGKNNYRKCSEALFQDENILLNDPDLLKDIYYAIHSACWFWKASKLNELADVEDLKTMTRRINGGYIGLEDRIHHYESAMEILS